ncbi:MAG: hypothetical protein SFX73_38075 [Kofleriaceae bacterium]|nr:hypothetical protein [Kofleriaceae bacterium]
MAAVDHLAEMRARELKQLAGQLPEERASKARTDAVIDLLWQCFSGTFFQVTMELRTAARTDPELRPVLVTAERALRDRIFAQARTLFGKDVAEHPGLERALDLTLQLMIGAAMSAVLHKEERRLDDLIEDWKQLFPAVLAQATNGRRPQSGRRREATGPKRS